MLKLSYIKAKACAVCNPAFLDSQYVLKSLTRADASQWVPLQHALDSCLSGHACFCRPEHQDIQGVECVNRRAAALTVIQGSARE
eukprot:2155858-Pleurochrysis_carterae.AAC.2